MAMLEQAITQQQGQLTDEQRGLLRQLASQERELLEHELHQSNNYERFVELCKVVGELTTRYRNIYSATHDLLRKTEEAALDELDELVDELNASARQQQQQQQQPSLTQTTTDLATLMDHAFTTKHHLYDPLLQRLASGHESGGVDAVTFDAAKLKGLWRCVEKMHRSSHAGHDMDSCDHILDVVRGCLRSSSVSGLVAALRWLRDSGEVVVLRVKNRLRDATASGWADCLVNFYFVADEHRHVCEVQLIPEKMFMVRKGMGGHDSYAHFRSAGEVVELLLPLHRDGDDDDRYALVDLFYSTGGDHWGRKDNWCSNAPLGSWHGVEVDAGGRVIKLDLGRNGLRGMLAWAS